MTLAALDRLVRAGKLKDEPNERRDLIRTGKAVVKELEHRL